MSIIIPANSAVGGGFEVANSCRFDSSYLTRTPSSASNRKTWTWSGWVKRSSLSTGNQILFEAKDSSGFVENVKSATLSSGFHTPLSSSNSPKDVGASCAAFINTTSDI